MNFFILRRGIILTPTIMMNLILMVVVIRLILFLAFLSLGKKPKDAIKYVYRVIAILVLILAYVFISPSLQSMMIFLLVI